MKVALLVVLLASVSSLATSIPPPPPVVSFSLSGIGSGLIGSSSFSPAELFSGEFSKNSVFGLTAYGTVGSSDWGGLFYDIMGSNNDETGINLHGGFAGGTFSNGILTSTFSGVEFVRVSPGNWIFWRVTGALAENLGFNGAPGTGSITLSSAVFEGRYSVGAEPSTYIQLGTGLCAIGGLIRRKLYCKIPPRNSTV